MAPVAQFNGVGVALSFIGALLLWRCVARKLGPARGGGCPYPYLL